MADTGLGNAISNLAADAEAERRRREEEERNRREEESRRWREENLAAGNAAIAANAPAVEPVSSSTPTGDAITNAATATPATPIVGEPGRPDIPMAGDATTPPAITTPPTDTTAATPEIGPIRPPGTMPTDPREPGTEPGTEPVVGPVDPATGLPVDPIDTPVDPVDPVDPAPVDPATTLPDDTTPIEAPGKSYDDIVAGGYNDQTTYYVTNSWDNLRNSDRTKLMMDDRFWDSMSPQQKQAFFESIHSKGVYSEVKPALTYEEAKADGFKPRATRAILDTWDLSSREEQAKIASDPEFMRSMSENGRKIFYKQWLKDQHRVKWWDGERSVEFPNSNGKFAVKDYDLDKESTLAENPLFNFLIKSKFGIPGGFPDGPIDMLNPAIATEAGNAWLEYEAANPWINEIKNEALIEMQAQNDANESQIVEANRIYDSHKDTTIGKKYGAWASFWKTKYAQDSNPGESYGDYMANHGLTTYGMPLHSTQKLFKIRNPSFAMMKIKHRIRTGGLAGLTDPLDKDYIDGIVSKSGSEEWRKEYMPDDDDSEGNLRFDVEDSSMFGGGGGTTGNVFLDDIGIDPTVFENPETAEHYKKIVEDALARIQEMEAPQMEGAQIAKVDTSDAEASRAQQMTLANMLMNQATGNLPSAAEIQLRQGLERQIKGAQAQSASAPGVSAALALRGQQQVAQQAGSEFNIQQSLLRADETQRAQQQLGQLTSQIRQQDLDIANFKQSYNLAQAQIDQATAGANLTAEMSTEAKKEALMQWYIGLGYDARMAEQQAKIMLEQMKLQAYGAEHNVALAQQQLDARRSESKQGLWGQLGSAAVQGVAGLGATLLGAFASDERVKKDIAPADKPIENFMGALNAESFKYKGDEKQNYGVMAQDMEKTPVGKSLISRDPQGVKNINTIQGFGTVLAGLSNLNERIRKLEV